MVTHDGETRSDVMIQGGSITRIGNLTGRSADTVVDAGGLLVLPGAVDPHVHFNDEFMGTVSVHDFETGTRAAAFGGVTSLIDFANQSSDGSLSDALEDKRAEAAGRALIDWGIHPVITRPDPATLFEIPHMVECGAPTIKCYMTYRGEGLMTGDADLERILAALRDAGGMLLVHAEDNDHIEASVPRLIEQGLTTPIHHARSRPPETEDLAIRRCLEIVRRTGGRLFVVHLASRTGMDLIAEARRDGMDVLAETCTHYLIFTEDMLKRADGIKWICSPPLRTPDIRDALWEGIRDGRIVQVSSDDAAYSWEAKKLGAERFDRCPNGIPGIETRLTLLHSLGVAAGRLSRSRWVELTSTAPARVFGLAPRKGRIAPGADADLVLFDPHEHWIMGRDTLHMNTDWSAFENIPITGRVKRVYSGGQLIIDQDDCLADPGRGRYLHRRLERNG